MPSCSWLATGWSCCEANQPGSGADIELWVAAKATVSSDREHSARLPLQVSVVGAALDVPPVPTKVAMAAAMRTPATPVAANVLPRCLRAAPAATGSAAVVGSRGL